MVPCSPPVQLLAAMRWGSVHLSGIECLGLSGCSLTLLDSAGHHRCCCWLMLMRLWNTSVPVLAQEEGALLVSQCAIFTDRCGWWIS